jgi:hypothetical protein
MTDVTAPRAFIGTQPCRVADTRGNGAPIQGGIFPNSGLRTWDVTGICGIPAGADAISVNFSVVSAPATPLGAFLLAWPTGQAPPPTAIMTYGPGATIISNAAIVPLGPSEQLQVNVSHSTHIVMDVNGYFSDVTAQPGTLRAVSSSVVAAIEGENTSLNAFSVGVRGRIASASPPFGSSGVEGVIVSTSPDGGTAGVRGSNNATGANGVGVWGSQNGSGWGVFGETPTGYGVNGQLTGDGPGDGSAAGVRGVALAALTQAPGVLGVNSGGGPGVRGESQTGSGVVGVSRTNGGIGVQGDLRASGGQLLAAGFLGADGLTKYGVLYVGGLGGSGTKSFLEPHPTDPSKEIRFVSLEGNEAGTYFRGRGRFQNGIAQVDVPEDFRIVTSPEGLSIQVTPIGQMATVAVESIGLDRIVVRGSRDVAFFYTVNGVRRAYPDVASIVPNEHFIPEALDSPLPLYLSPDERQRLIDNGTYRPDGTVNIETARRLGWEATWKKRGVPARLPEEP